MKLDNQDKFIPENISLTDFTILDEHITDDITIQQKDIESYPFKTEFEIATNLENKLIQLTFKVLISTNLKNNKERLGDSGKALFTFLFGFEVSNLDELAQINGDVIEIAPNLAKAITSISYSTVRGCLFSRLQHTCFSSFMLPVISSERLIRASSQ